MVLEFDLNSAKSTIYNLKVTELKTLLSFDNLPKNGLKEDLQKRCLAHLDSNQKSENFLNAIKDASHHLAQAQNKSKFRNLYLHSIYLKLS